MLSIRDALCLEDFLADDSWDDFSNESAASWKPVQAAAALPLPREEFTKYLSHEAGIPSNDLTSFAKSTMVSSSTCSASRATANNFDWSVFASPSKSLQSLNKPSPTLGTGHLLSNRTMVPFSSLVCSAVPVHPKNNDAPRHSAQPPPASYQHRSTAAEVPAACSVSASGVKRNWCNSGFSSAELSSLPNGSSDGSKSLKPADEATPSKKACLRQGSHSENERVRRKNMSRNFQVLKTIVPGEHERIDKATVLKKSISYIKALEEQLKKLREQRNELKQKFGITSHRSPSSGTLADVSASKPDRRKCDSLLQPSSASSNCIHRITVGGCHASFTLYTRNSKKGFLPELLAAMEASKQHVRHAYVRELEGSTVYMIHMQVADGRKEADEGKIRAMLQKVVNDTGVSFEEA